MKGFLVPAGLALALCVPLAGCNAPAAKSEAPVDTAAAAAAVKAAEADMLAAFKTKNAGAVAEHYTDDATLMLAGKAPITGTGDIMKSLSEQFMNPGFALDIKNEKVEVAGSGDLAYSRGTYKASATNFKTNKVESETGAYLTVFKKQEDGSWKAIEDISTPDK